MQDQYSLLTNLAAEVGVSAVPVVVTGVPSVLAGVLLAYSLHQNFFCSV